MEGVSRQKRTSTGMNNRLLGYQARRQEPGNWRPVPLTARRASTPRGKAETSGGQVGRSVEAAESAWPWPLLSSDTLFDRARLPGILLSVRTAGARSICSGRTSHARGASAPAGAVKGGRRAYDR